MPIFVSRFSSARAGLANFLSLRASGEESRVGRGSARQEQETDQTGPSGEDQTGAVSRLLATSQRADRIAQSIAEQTTPTQTFQQSASGIGASENTTAEIAPEFSQTNAGSETPTFTQTLATSETPTFTQTNAAETPTFTQTNAAPETPATGTTSELTLTQRLQLNQRAEQLRQTHLAQFQQNQRTQTPQNQRAQTRQNQRVTDVRLAIQPALQSTVRRLDNLTRLISAQRRDQSASAGETAVVGAQTRLTTSLKINQSAAQASVVRTAQAVQTARAAQVQASIQETQSQTPDAAENAQVTVSLKQNLREDVATVTRGLIRDAAQQSNQNFRQVAQNLLRSQAQQAQTTIRWPRPSSSLTRPGLLSASPLRTSSSNGSRQAPTISNLSPLRSALAMLGTKVNILIG